MGIQLKSHEVRGELMLVLSGRLTILDQALRDAIRQSLTAGYRQFILKMYLVIVKRRILAHWIRLIETSLMS